MIVIDDAPKSQLPQPQDGADRWPAPPSYQEVERATNITSGDSRTTGTEITPSAGTGPSSSSDVEASSSIGNVFNVAGTKLGESTSQVNLPQAVISSPLVNYGRKMSAYPPTPAPNSPAPPRKLQQRRYSGNRISGSIPDDDPNSPSGSSLRDSRQMSDGPTMVETEAKPDELGSSSRIVRVQPGPTKQMRVDMRDVGRKPIGSDGERDWDTGICGCCHKNCGTCFYATVCPCMVYSALKSRLSYLERNNHPHPRGGSSFSVDCMIHGTLMTCALGWVLQNAQRTSIRDRYRIRGSGCGDCMCAVLCTPCTLAQEEREVRLEERALRSDLSKETLESESTE